jgi:penicillin-binding protein 2
VFKVVAMAAALESRLDMPESRYVRTGIWREFGTRYDWEAEAHGNITLDQGLSASCNSWFYGWRLGIQDPASLSLYAHTFGLGAKTGIEIPEEGGFVPESTWKKSTFGEDWWPDDSINLGIGQGDLLVTPIQIAIMTAAIANDGTLYRPHLIKAIGPALNSPTMLSKLGVNGILPVSQENLEAIQQGMHGATSDDQVGTAAAVLGSLPISNAGKTGTAQMPGDGVQPMAWFAGYVPYEQPEVAIVVVVENGGVGAIIAAPIFRRILEQWYGLLTTDYPTDWRDQTQYEFIP